MNLFKRGKKKIGLALGSGSAKGFAHIGVLQAIMEEDICIDMISGTSMGAIIGAYYAKNLDITGFRDKALGFDAQVVRKLADPNVAFLYKGILYGKKIREMLKKIIGDIDFKDLKIPLSVIAADANTGEEVVIKDGSVLDAVMSSISIPLIFTPVKYKGRFLVDGGIVNPVPAETVREMGADFVIACNVMHIPKKKRERTAAMKGIFNANHKSEKTFFSPFNNKFGEAIRERYNAKINKIDPDTPNIIDVVIRTIYIMEYEIMKMKVKSADILISPNTDNVGLMEFHKAKEAISAGYLAAMEEFSKNKYPK